MHYTRSSTAREWRGALVSHGVSSAVRDGGDLVRAEGGAGLEWHQFKGTRRSSSENQCSTTTM